MGTRLVRFWRRDARTGARAETIERDDVVGPTFVFQVIRRRHGRQGRNPR